jgi:hypothetical protein
MIDNCIICFTNTYVINNAAAQRKVPRAHLQLHRAPKRNGTNPDALRLRVAPAAPASGV